jgi:hypothetical protein
VAGGLEQDVLEEVLGRVVVAGEEECRAHQRAAAGVDELVERSTIGPTGHGHLLSPCTTQATPASGGAQGGSISEPAVSDAPMNAGPPLAISAEGAAEDAESTVYSNVTIVNALFEEFLDEDEISEDALAAYYGDYYLAEVNNGGHDQFLFNSQLRGTFASRVGQGLRPIGAPRHTEIFDRTIGAIDALPAGERRRAKARVFHGRTCPTTRGRFATCARSLVSSSVSSPQATRATSTGARRRSPGTSSTPLTGTSTWSTRA